MVTLVEYTLTAMFVLQHIKRAQSNVGRYVRKSETIKGLFNYLPHRQGGNPSVTEFALRLYTHSTG